MTTIAQIAHGESIRQSETPFAQGSEAAEHDVSQYPNLTVKLYHPQVLVRRRDSLRTKIEAMSNDPALTRLGNQVGPDQGDTLGSFQNLEKPPPLSLPAGLETN